MADYISREAAINNLYKLLCKVDEDGYRWVLSRDVAHMIDEIPAADVRPVVKARWYWDNYKYDWCCSNCLYPADHRVDKNDVFKEPSFPFCPHCGADMRKPNLNITTGDNND